MNEKKTFLALVAATGLLLASVAVAHDEERDESEGEAQEASEIMQGGIRAR